MNPIRKYFFFPVIVLLVLLFVSCRPKGVLSQKEMTDVLYDIHLAESITNTGVLDQHLDWRGGLENNYFRDLSYQAVLKKHNITEEDFFKSVAYYSKNLKTYTRIYENIEKRYSRLYEDIQNGLYHSGLSDTLKFAKEDSIRIRNLYTKYGYLTDTVNFFKNSFYPDSVVSWTAGFTKEWKSVKDTFYIINPKDYVLIKEIRADTTTTADSLKKPEEIKPEKREEIRKVGDGIQVVVN